MKTIKKLDLTRETVKALGARTSLRTGIVRVSASSVVVQTAVGCPVNPQTPVVSNPNNPGHNSNASFSGGIHSGSHAQ